MSQLYKRVLLINAFEFRRACLHNFLAPWAGEECLDLISLPPHEAHERIVHDGGFAMLIYDAASSYVSFHRRLAEIQVLRTLCPTTPIAVLSDSEDPEELGAMFDVGVQAYLHDAVAPDIALRALSFVVHGGTYFSPSAMVAAYHRVGFGARSPPRALPGFSDPQGEGKPHVDEAIQHIERSESALQPAVEGYPGEAAQAVQPTFGRMVQLPDRPGKAHKQRADSSLLTERQQAVLQHLCQGDPNKTIAKKLNLTETTVKVHVREIMRKLGVFNRTQVAVVVGRSNVESGEANNENAE